MLVCLHWFPDFDTCFLPQLGLNRHTVCEHGKRPWIHNKTINTRLPEQKCTCGMKTIWPNGLTLSHCMMSYYTVGEKQQCLFSLMPLKQQNNLVQKLNTQLKIVWNNIFQNKTCTKMTEALTLAQNYQTITIIVCTQS